MKSKSFEIIPQPQVISFDENKSFFGFGNATEIFCSKQTLKESKILQEALKKSASLDVSISVADLGEHLIFISQGKKDGFEFRRKFEKNLKPEGYELCISGSEIVFSGNDRNGLFYAVQTFLQILRQTAPDIPACVISDWPNLELRGIHLDLKGRTPNFEYLKSIIKTASSYKINAILCEYEDKFLFEKNPEIADKNLAFSKNEIKEFVELAQVHNIEIIPLLQCLGHVEYILKLEKYKELAELPDEIQQFCPSNPKSLALFRELFYEMIEQHPGSEYFHVGGDEAHFLGACPECAKKGATDVYLDYMKEIFSLLRENNKTPVIWHDMLGGMEEEKLKTLLPYDPLIFVWDYHVFDKKRAFFKWKGTRISKTWLEKKYPHDFYEAFSMDSAPIGDSFWEDIPKEKLEISETCLKSDSFPEAFSSYPYYERLKNMGFSLVSASAAGMGNREFYTLRGRKSFFNIKELATCAYKNKGLGTVATSWARDSSLHPSALPFEFFWQQYAALGEFSWNGEEISEEKFDLKFNIVHFGIENKKATDAINLLTLAKENNFLLNETLKIFAELKKSAKQNQQLLDCMSIACKILIHKNRKDLLFAKMQTSFPLLRKGSLLNVERLKILNLFNELKEDLASLEEEIKGRFGKIMPDKEVEEFCETRFELGKKQIEEFIEMLNKTEER